MSYEIIYDLSYRCQICIYKKISTGFYFCDECAKEYQLVDEKGKFKKPTDWPDWAREMYNIAKRKRRRDEVISESCVDFDDEHTEEIRHNYPEEEMSLYNLR